MDDLLFQGEKFVTLATGRRVSRNHGFVTVPDMAFSSGRLCRWTGNLQFYWPVLLHSMVVADLVPPRLGFHAIMHDCSDPVTNDTPKPMKTDEMSEIERGIFDRTCLYHKIQRLTADEHAIIKEADNASRNAEAWVLGQAGHRRAYPKRHPEAESLVRMYHQKYSLEDCIVKYGRAQLDFIAKANALLFYRRMFLISRPKQPWEMFFVGYGSVRRLTSR